jgi:hypothetical protein
MATLRAIREALKATLKAQIPGLTAYDTVPSSPNLPAAVPIPRAASFERGEGPGVDITWLFDLDVLCSAAITELGEISLDDLVDAVGPKSVSAALRAGGSNNPLGIPRTKAWVTGMRGYGVGFTAASIDHVGAVLELQIITAAVP